MTVIIFQQKKEPDVLIKSYYDCLLLDLFFTDICFQFIQRIGTLLVHPKNYFVVSKCVGSLNLH